MTLSSHSFLTRVYWVFAFVVTATCLAAQGPASASEAEQLHRLFDEEWELRLREFPQFATSVGRHEWDHLLPSMAPEDHYRRRGLWQKFLDRLDRIDRGALGPEDQINYDIFRRQVSDTVTSAEFGAWQVPLTSDSGFHTAFARLPYGRFNSVEDYENYYSRLKAFPRYVEQHIAGMRQGLARGMTLPQVVLQGYDHTAAGHVVDKVEDSVFYTPLTRFPPAVSERERARLLKEGERAILQGAIPGYQRFLTFLQEEYIPGARTTLGAAKMPRGREYYEFLVRHFTTLELSADEVHRIGLKEVARIRSEMDEVMRQVQFEGSFDEFLTFLRTDPRFYAETPEQLLREASYIAKRMDAKLPALFKTLPRLPYGVEPVPDHLAPKYTTGRYVGPAKGSNEPGYYWVNTYDLPSRPLYVLESLTLHEAVPGHHLQISLSEELEGLPNFRRFSYLSAHGEGWGLYSEWLGLEAGFYTDPYSNFGRLTYEMWRACRLVVDTGIHVMGWDRQKAIDYLAGNTALSIHEVTTEIDRYISWPGQALSYKIGELKIKELRRQAEQELGQRFDVREFHDVVIGSGSVPLTVLEDLVQAWIAEVSSKR